MILLHRNCYVFRMYLVAQYALLVHGGGPSRVVYYLRDSFRDDNHVTK